MAKTYCMRYVRTRNLSERSLYVWIIAHRFWINRQIYVFSVMFLHQIIQLTGVYFWKIRKNFALKSWYWMRGYRDYTVDTTSKCGQKNILFSRCFQHRQYVSSHMFLSLIIYFPFYVREFSVLSMFYSETFFFW